jgi:hypothetical protein
MYLALYLAINLSVFYFILNTHRLLIIGLPRGLGTKIHVLLPLSS